ncbi:MAG: hypothetical protein ACXVCY_12010 [Pseudobdellovibrionaceae bacterium]
MKLNILITTMLILGSMTVHADADSFEKQKYSKYINIPGCDDSRNYHDCEEAVISMNVDPAEIESIEVDNQRDYEYVHLKSGEQWKCGEIYGREGYSCQSPTGERRPKFEESLSDKYDTQQTSDVSAIEGCSYSYGYECEKVLNALKVVPTDVARISFEQIYYSRGAFVLLKNGRILRIIEKDYIK